MDHETKLAELMKQAEENAQRLERAIQTVRDMGELPFAFSREALVEELGFDLTLETTTALPSSALRA
jgi:hypothetical protein